jgi:hypothetical protein
VKTWTVLRDYGKQLKVQYLSALNLNVLDSDLNCLDVQSISYLQALFSAVFKAVVHGMMQPYVSHAIFLKRG